jgi:hypothetical protein
VARRHVGAGEAGVCLNQRRWRGKSKRREGEGES